LQYRKKDLIVFLVRQCPYHNYTIIMWKKRPGKNY
jgi:hypothetical protein